MTGNLLTFGLFVLVLSFALVTTPAQAEQNAFSTRVARSADDIHPLLVGMKVPDVVLMNVEGNPVRLYSFLSEKPTVLVFYRGGWCPYCNVQLAQLRTIENDVLELGYQIVAISADRFENAAKSIEKHNLHYTLLSDSAKVAAKAFGLAFKVDEKTLERYSKFGIDLEAASGVNDHILPVPAVFIIQNDGSIVFEYVNPNYKVRLNAQVLLAILKVENERAKTESKETKTHN
ncbi:MAG: AhpC/TSA family protein [Bacteroidota bacterium]|nr:AhpC/TSA family protein [Bacteroidota bacterium]